VSSITEHSENLIESRVEAHDSQQFEVKLDYSIDPKKRRNQYRVEAYIFIPKSLGINRDTYSTEHFFRDTQSYIRFKTPSIDLKDLLSPGAQHSPFIRLKSALATLGDKPTSEPARRKLLRELKLLACQVRANMRDRIRDLVERLPEPDSAQKNEEASLSESAICEVVSEIKMVFEAYRNLKPELLHKGVGFEIQDTYQKVDEYLSLVLENHLTHLYEALEELYDETLFATARVQSSQLLRDERDYRDASDYPRILEGGVPNEHYLYRRGLLKKMAMSVLFLKVNKEDSGDGHSDLIASIAAGVAMVFAVFTGIWAQMSYGLNTGPFIVALVLSYVLKDRIKDWIKRYYSAFIAYRLWDRSTQIIDPTHGGAVGRCREQVEHLSKSKVPASVLKNRHAGEPDSVEAQAKQESCIRYNKEIRLDGKNIDLNHGRLSDVNDIMRFNIWRMLILADDPKHDVRLFNVKQGQVETVVCPKVYHLNILLRFYSGLGHELVSSERVRVVFDRDGIRHLDLLNA
jgi:hypothetical protein